MKEDMLLRWRIANTRRLSSKAMHTANKDVNAISARLVSPGLLLPKKRVNVSGTSRGNSQWLLDSPSFCGIDMIQIRVTLGN